MFFRQKQKMRNLNFRAKSANNWTFMSIRVQLLVINKARFARNVKKWDFFYDFHVNWSDFEQLDGTYKLFSHGSSIFNRSYFNRFLTAISQNSQSTLRIARRKKEILFRSSSSHAFCIIGSWRTTFEKFKVALLCRILFCSMCSLCLKIENKVMQWNENKKHEKNVFSQAKLKYFKLIFCIA